MYHLAWFLGVGCGLPEWDPAAHGPFTGRIAEQWTSPAMLSDLARSLERGGFSYLLIEDTTQLDDHYAGTAEVTLKRAWFSPKNDPIPMSVLLANATKHIGIVPTVSSSFYHPYHAARLFTTLDHLSEGRIGMNLVTSSSDIAAQNYGMEALPPKDVRYDIANEWMEVFRGLEDCWDPDAVVMDYESGTYADFRKVRRLDHVGKHFNVRGPLNTIPGPQRHVPLVEAGNSPAGRDLAARFSSSIIGNPMTVEEAKELKADMTRRVIGHGRDPSEFKTMYACSPIIGETDDDAKRRQEAFHKSKREGYGIEWMQWYLDKLTPFDFSKVDMEMSVGEFKATVANQPNVISTVERMFRVPDDMSFRDVLATRAPSTDMGLVGSPATVARKMDEMMEEVGGDGFLIYLPVTRRCITEVCDGLAWELQRRGSIRKSYEHKTFKDNLLAF